MEECRWFFGCHNDAEFLVEHPTLGEVPTCVEHVDWLTKLTALSEPEPVGPVGTARYTIR